MKYKKLEYIPTWKIKEILDSNYCTGIDGHDYGPVKEELEQIYWSRLEKQDELKCKEIETNWRSK